MTTLSDEEFNREVTIREAYLAVFDFLEKNWAQDNSVEIGQVLGEIALWDTPSGKAPMDGAVLPSFLSSVARVQEEMRGGSAIARAEISLKK